MSPFNLLLVEDSEDEIETFKSSMERYCSEKDREIHLTTTTNCVESLKALNNDFFDGAIVDLKLKQESYAGNKILETILNKFRIPVVAYTANPENVPAEFIGRVKVYPRASILYDVPLDYLFDLYNTGLTRIIGGRGSIEENLNKVFWNIIDKQLTNWIEYKNNGKETEKGLLRLVINNIVELIDEEEEKYYPEEMYIFSENLTNFKTGRIVKEQGIELFYIILSPACDLALRNNGVRNTDQVLICNIELKDDLMDNRKYKSLRQNNGGNYYHFLPKVHSFSGGLINFRYLRTIPVDDFLKLFDLTNFQISAPFIKDIIARFSSYYARQGQPDFNLEN